jgi:hypothetical protein
MSSHQDTEPLRDPPPHVDAPEERRRVTVDRRTFVDRARFVCPRQHMDWDRTNCHVWCRGCRRLVEAGHDAVDPEYYVLYDKREGVLIPYECVEIEP